MRRLTYYIAVSMDGRIAELGDESDFYPQPEEYIAWIAGGVPGTPSPLTCANM